MKQFIPIITTLLIMQGSFAQAPQKMSYQAVIRNSRNALVKSAPVGMRISIIQGSIFGAPVYVETQTPSTNANGLVSFEIGTGKPVTGTFAGINWANGPYFIQTETDPKGGTAYAITGTNQLISVPYASFSENGTPDSAVGYPAHMIGERYGGGIVFYVYDNGQHGLIAAAADQSTGIQWYNGTYRYTGTTGDGLGAGAMNTSMIVALQMADKKSRSFAAKVCADYSVTDSGITYGDWYLPSKYELYLLYLQRNVVGGFANEWYWSSTEGDASSAWYFSFLFGNAYYDDKVDSSNYVRAVRSF